MIKSLTPCLGLIGEVESGFLSAAILAAYLSGMNLAGISLRSGNNQAQIHWQLAQSDMTETQNRALYPGPIMDRIGLLELCRQFTQDYLRRRGEPASYIQLHAATLEAMVQAHQLTSFPMENSTKLMHEVEEIIQETFSYRGNLSRYGGSSRSLEVGYWWLDKSIEDSSSMDILPPLADRVETDVVDYLLKNPGRSLDEIDQKVCTIFTGLFTPDRELIEECVFSYGEQKPPESNHWQLRAQDSPITRQADLESIKYMIGKMGERLYYKVDINTEHNQISLHEWEYILWIDADDSIAYAFYVLASSVISRIIFSTSLPRYIPSENDAEIPPRNILVLPGGRSNLVRYKLHHDPRLRNAVESNWRFVKFRHIRWLAEIKTLNRENLNTQLDQDPPETKDPQLTLL
jgi:hypothetical protein